jgi:hypothetical protein
VGFGVRALAMGIRGVKGAYHVGKGAVKGAVRTEEKIAKLRSER